MIKSARERAGLSQSQAAKAWDIPIGTLQAWEQGVRRPGGVHLAKLLPIIIPEVKEKSRPGKADR